MGKSLTPQTFIICLQWNHRHVLLLFLIQLRASCYLKSPLCNNRNTELLTFYSNVSLVFLTSLVFFLFYLSLFLFPHPFILSSFLLSFLHAHLPHFWYRTSLCSSDWLWSYDPPAPAFQVLELYPWIPATWLLCQHFRVRLFYFVCVLRWGSHFISYIALNSFIPGPQPPEQFWYQGCIMILGLGCLISKQIS